MAEVVRIFNENGTASDYELLASRLPKFLDKYGPDKGYRIVIETKDFLSVRGGLLKLYEAALVAGIKPKDAGLPPIARGIVFTAKLMDSNGVAILTASALHPVSEYKDWEIGETAARQRLVAAAGFDGQSIRQDEKLDLDEQKKKAMTPMPPVSEDKPKPKSTRRGGRGKGNGKQPKEEEVMPPKSSTVIPPAMLLQIEHLAKTKGKKVSTPSTMEEAKAVMKDLLSS